MWAVVVADLIDPDIASLLPQRDWASRRTAIVEGTSAVAALAAARAVTVAELPGLPEQRQVGETDLTVLEDLLNQGFLLVSGHRVPPSLLFLRVGRIWQGRRPDLGIRTAEDFAAFAEPGFAKAVLSFAAVDVRGGVFLAVETTLTATDQHTRRELNRGWLVDAWANSYHHRALLQAVAARLGSEH